MSLSHLPVQSWFVSVFRREGSAGLLRDGDSKGMSYVKKNSAENMRFGFRRLIAHDFLGRISAA